MKKKRYPTKRAAPKKKTKKLTKAQVEQKEFEVTLENLNDFEITHAAAIREGLFVNEYLKDFNGTRAAKAAGYSQEDKVAATQAWRLLRKEEIQRNINERLRQRVAVQKFDADSVLEALIENHSRCAQAVPVLDMEGKPTGIWKFDAKGSNKALELIGRHFELFPTKVTHANDPDNPLPAAGSVIFYLPDNGRPATPKH